MKQVIIPIDECSEGDVLAADVLNNSGVKLVTSQTVLNIFIINKLADFGVDRISVFNPPLITKTREYSYKKFIGNYKESVLLVKDMIHELSAGKRIDYNNIVSVSDIIYSHVEENANIINCLKQMRGSDEYTYSHSVNTSFYSMLISKWLGFSEDDIMKALQAGFLHDIGKSKIPLEILNKTGPLTGKEFSIIKKHPIYGYYILHENKHIDFDIKRAVLLHHERENRSGYPFRLSTDSIGSFARIVSVADVYDAITSDRVYKKKSTPFKAFEMFLTEGVRQFDSTVINAFISNLSTYLIGSEVLLSTGETGKIAYIPPTNVTAPIIQVGDNYVELSNGGEITIENML
ncbi:MAG TPA: HD-GYP domain-containing protein [Clostridia bacterium]|nr:HD-GYP domain-containing protein [Clostridia bacterium]